MHISDNKNVAGSNTSPDVWDTKKLGWATFSKFLYLCFNIAPKTCPCYKLRYMIYHCHQIGSLPSHSFLYYSRLIILSGNINSLADFQYIQKWSMELRSAEKDVRDMLALYEALRKSTTVDPRLSGLPEVISAMEALEGTADLSSETKSLQQVVQTLDQIKEATIALEPKMSKFRKRLSEVSSNNSLFHTYTYFWTTPLLTWLFDPQH